MLFSNSDSISGVETPLRQPAAKAPLPTHESPGLLQVTRLEHRGQLDRDIANAIE